MRVLIVANCNNGKFSPFITEQAESVSRLGAEVYYFGIVGKGFMGYLRNLPTLKRKIKQFKPDIVHAHYGLSGLLANLQRKVPVVTTYHGSDINIRKVLCFSKIAMRLSAFNVFVSKQNALKAKVKQKYIVLPCGVNLDNYPIVQKHEARKQMHLDAAKKYVLFAGAFDNGVKNSPLAQETCALIPEVELIELKNYSRREVALLMQAVNAFLMTSLTEGSPQVIKEAMACGCPIVSVDVGDVKKRLQDLAGCFVSEERTPKCLAALLGQALSFEKRTAGREKIIADGLENKLIAQRLVEVYNKYKKV